MPRNESKQELLTLEFVFPLGTGEIEVAQDHPLMSVFGKAIRTGKGTGTWLYLLARQPGEDAPTFLGTFARTPGRRLLFFPGRAREVMSDHAHGVLNGRVIEHLTLELSENMDSWSEHIAVEGASPSRGHRASGKVRCGFMHPWFSLLLPNLDSYSRLPRKLLFRFNVPASDVVRRLPVMMDRGQQSAPPDLDVLGNANPGYYQIDVWAARGPDWHLREACVLPLACEKGLVEEAPDRQEALNCRQTLKLSEDFGVIVFYTRPQGRPVRPGLWHARIDTTE